MTSKFTYMNPIWTRQVAVSMRQDDVREIGSSMFVNDRDDLTEKVVLAAHICCDMMWTGWCRGEPVWIGGAVPKRPGVWELVSFATDDFHHIRFGVTRLVTRVIIPAVFRGGAHRVYATTVNWRRGGKRWLEVLGLEYEGTQKGSLSDGSDLLMYTKTGEIQP